MAILHVTKFLKNDQYILDFVLDSFDIVKLLKSDSKGNDIYYVRRETLLTSNSITITVQSSKSVTFGEINFNPLLTVHPIDGFVTHDGLYYKCWLHHY